MIINEQRQTNGRRQVGPTLYWQIPQPKMGELVKTGEGWAGIIEITADPADGGWLFVVELVP